MPFIITGMKWDRCESQLCFVLLWLPPTTLMFLQCRTGPGFFSILKFSPMTVCIFQASRIAEDKCHDHFPDHVLCSFMGHLGSKISPETQKMESMGGREKGDCKALSVLPHQIIQSNKIWCQNNLCANLCLEEALRSMQKVVQHNAAKRCRNNTKLW